MLFAQLSFSRYLRFWPRASAQGPKSLFSSRWKKKDLFLRHGEPSTHWSLNVLSKKIGKIIYSKLKKRIVRAVSKFCYLNSTSPWPPILIPPTSVQKWHVFSKNIPYTYLKKTFVHVKGKSSHHFLEPFYLPTWHDNLRK